MLKLLYGKSKEEILADQEQEKNTKQMYVDAFLMRMQTERAMAEQQYRIAYAAKMEAARKERLAKWERRRTAK
jgi:hypothetical protein